MDPILTILLSWQFILFGLAVAGVVYVVRILVEYFIQLAKRDPKTSKFWSELVLPILPVALGALAAVKFKSFPYPDGLVTRGDRIIFGLVAGLLSTLLYRIVKGLLSAKEVPQQTINVVIENKDNSIVTTTTTKVVEVNQGE
jgi:phosphoglycerol transferase MdoB-like AlkP superfamily enzyme